LWDLNSRKKLKVINLEEDENGEKFAELKNESRSPEKTKKRSMSAAAVISKRL
jgi:hypothetical protein